MSEVEEPRLGFLKINRHFRLAGASFSLGPSRPNTGIEKLNYAGVIQAKRAEREEELPIEQLQGNVAASGSYSLH
jgi:hypothetical protein